MASNAPVERERKHRDPAPLVEVVGAAIIERGRCLVARRSPTMSEAGHWEFPGGKVEAGESPQQALQREIAEELGLSVRVGEHLGRGHCLRGGRTIVLDVYVARQQAGALRLSEHSEARWIEAGEIDDLSWAEADRPVLAALETLLGRTEQQDTEPSLAL